MQKRFLEVGEIVKPHGIFGAVKVCHWCDNAEVFKQFKYLFLDLSGKIKKKVEFLHFIKNFIVLKFFDLTSIDEAKKYVGLVLYVDRIDFKIPEGRVFIQDLIGTCVVNYLDEGLCYGKIVDVLNYGANDIYKIRDDKCNEFFIPVIDEIVIRKDLKRQLVFIKPMKGLFDV